MPDLHTNYLPDHVVYDVVKAGLLRISLCPVEGNTPYRPPLVQGGTSGNHFVRG